MSAVLPASLRARRRRLRIVYTSVLGAVVLVVALTMGLVIGTGEAAHATLSTSTAAAPVPGGTVGSTPRAVWSTTDHPATGDPLWVGTVITWSAHQLSGRDAVTGAIRWSYRRTDVDICDAAQSNGRAFVLFRRDGNCDELSTFDADTGARGWFRTLPDNGTGHMLFSSAGLVLVYPESIHVVVAVRGIDQFNSATQPSGCSITSAAAGDAGILLTQRCGDGAHLALLSNVGSGSGSPQVLWRLGVDAAVRALGAKQFAMTYDPDTGEAALRSVTNGSLTAIAPITPTPSGSAGPTTTTVQNLVVELGSELTAITLLGTVAWTRTDVRGPAESVDTLDSALLVATPTGASRLDTTTGAETATYRFAAPAAGSRIYPAGDGLLVAGSGLAYLR